MVHEAPGTGRSIDEATNSPASVLSAMSLATPDLPSCGSVVEKLAVTNWFLGTQLGTMGYFCLGLHATYATCISPHAGYCLKINACKPAKKQKQFVTMLIGGRNPRSHKSTICMTAASASFACGSCLRMQKFEVDVPECGVLCSFGHC